jgi:hypothetical protein
MVSSSACSYRTGLATMGGLARATHLPDPQVTADRRETSGRHDLIAERKRTLTDI